MAENRLGVGPEIEVSDTNVLSGMMRLLLMRFDSAIALWQGAPARDSGLLHCRRADPRKYRQIYRSAPMARTAIKE